MSTINSIGAISGSSPVNTEPKAASGFQELVQQKVTFSRHAAARMQERHINLSQKDMALLEEAMGKARTTGANKAAIVMDSGIFIVAPGSNTVITTVPKESAQPMQVISEVDAMVLVGGASSEGASSPRPTDGGQPTPVHWSLIQNTDQ